MTMTTMEPLSDARHGAELRKAVIAATVGTTIEWYDFFIYGTAAGLVFGKLYFPNTDPLSATLLAFAGGPAPLIATALFAAYHTGYAIAIYLALCGVISLISTAYMPDYTSKDVSSEY